MPKVGLIMVALFVAAVAPIGIARAQFPGVTQELIAHGSLGYLNQGDDEPTDAIVARIRMEPGSRFGRWHTHPGPVLIIVNAGEVAVYGPDGCRRTYAAGDAYTTQPNTLYDLRNESDQAAELVAVGVLPSGQETTTLLQHPDAYCGE